MTQGKGTYSLISVDVAPDEEVVRVDAQGVHRKETPAVSDDAFHGQEEHRHGKRSDGAKPDDSLLCGGASRGNDDLNAKESTSQSSRDADSDSYDGRDDLEGPVPMAGMQRIIIVAVVVCLVTFAVYFAVSHG